jgi:hypothetical protein
MTDETSNIQNVGIQMGEGAAVGGDVTGRDKITAGGHVIQAAQGATVIINAGPAAGQAGEGLNALTDLVQRSAEVREAVIGFRTDFQAASEQIDLLIDYKDLHDILHRLQFQCYNSLQQAAPRFPNDDTALDVLTDAQLTLEGILAEVQAFTKRASEAKQDTGWLQDLTDTKTEVRGALDNSDSKPLKKAIWRLNRMLSTQPAKINGRLNTAARALRLSSLTNALNSIVSNVQSLDFDTAKKAAFEKGVNGLVALSFNLTALIESHDAWQTVDVELRRVETLIEHDLTELEMSWPDLKDKADNLFGGVAEDWATAMQKEAEGLDAALGESNPAKIKRSFRSFRRRASDRFFRVDVDLKTLCGELRQVGQPLASVLKMIE